MNTSPEHAVKQVNADSLDVVHLLFQDVYRLPIMTSQHQEMWLGIQMKATNWIGQLCNKIGLDPAASNSSLPLIRAAYEVLMRYVSNLEACCRQVLEIQPPRLEAWAAELLSVRQDVFELRRSRVRRFVRTLANVENESIRNELIDSAYNIAELLCLLPNSALNHIIEFEEAFERLPLTNELTEPLEASTTPEHLLLVERQAMAARDTLVVGYLRYALRVARNYVDQGLDYADLAQEGFVGLMKAADRFDYRQQARFGTYATSWIWQNIGRSIADQGRTVRLPAYMEEQIRKLEEAYKKTINSGNSNPALMDIILHADLLPDEELEVLKRLRSDDTTLVEHSTKHCEKALQRVQRLMTYAQPTIPLDLTIPDRVMRNVSALVRDCLPDDVALSDLIPDWDSPAPGTVVDQMIIKGKIERAFEELTTREQGVITLRFGLKDSKDCTLEEVGQKLGLTRERIRQIEKNAIEKLKLASYLLSVEAVPSETSLIYLPLEVLDYLDREFNHWHFPEGRNGKQEWHWLDRLIDQLPSGDWHRERYGYAITRQDQLVAALRTLSAPAHCSDITEQFNDTLEQEVLDERYVYTLLMKHEQTFLLLGQGVFSLLEWERGRTAQTEPSLPFCPSPLPDPPGQSDAFFESVMIAREILRRQPTASQFFQEMFRWAGVAETQPKWFQQSVLSAYYLVGLIPYTFCFDGSNPRLECTLPEMGLHELRRYCLQKLTERLMAMPEFWWTFKRYQPARASALGEQFTEIHPLGLDDAINRLSILTSLGASHKLTYGQYRLTLLGEELADHWKRRPDFAHGAETVQEPQPEDDLEPIDLAIW